jgi:large subunit ribosomal protein L30
MAKANKALLKVTQIRSALKRSKKQRATLAGLGLKRLNRSRLVRDTLPIRGMIAKVQHLVRVEEMKD